MRTTNKRNYQQNIFWKELFVIMVLLKLAIIIHIFRLKKDDNGYNLMTLQLSRFPKKIYLYKLLEVMMMINGRVNGRNNKPQEVPIFLSINDKKKSQSK